MEHLYEYLVFLAEAITLVVVILLIIGSIYSASAKHSRPQAHLDVERVNDRLDDMQRSLKHAFMEEAEYKKFVRQEKKHDKAKQKQKKQQKTKSVEADAAPKPRLFVVDFHGDLQASRVDLLRNEITALLTEVKPEDEILVRIESAGGMVHGYGLAASQLHRIKNHGVRLVAAIDKVAASGGYLMAAVADHIISAPFAVVGSIGVVAQIPNVHRLLKKHDIDVEVLTAGEYKRTLTIFGENTDADRQKFIEELNDVHALFQDFVTHNRSQVNIDEVATGEAWHGHRALEKKLVDELLTSDEYIMQACKDRDVFEVKWQPARKPLEKLAARFTTAISQGVVGALEKLGFNLERR